MYLITLQVLLAESARAAYDEMTRHDAAVVRAILEEHILFGPGGSSVWIWHGEGFTSADGVVFVAPFMDLRPFVHSLPADMIVFTELFAAFGVKRSCSLTDVLKMIRRKHQGDVEETKAVEGVTTSEGVVAAEEVVVGDKADPTSGDAKPAVPGDLNRKTGEVKIVVTPKEAAVANFTAPQFSASEVKRDLHICIGLVFRINTIFQSYFEQIETEITLR